MSVPIIIEDGGNATSNKARVTEFGELVTGSIEYSTACSLLLNAPATAFNCVQPASGKRIVITSIILNANNSVDPTSGATITIYEADDADTLVSVSDLLVININRQQTVPIASLNLITAEGSYVNVVTDDASVNATILYYYLPIDII